MGKEDIVQRSLVGGTLLVGIDFSECCERALHRAVAIAEQNRAQLRLVHVFEWLNPVELGSGGEVPDPVASSVSGAVLSQARISLQQLGRLCSHLVADRVPAEIRVLIGDPAVALQRIAGQLGVSLIVLGAQGRRMIPRATVGSTTARVCADSAQPVLLVPDAARTEVREGSWLFVSARQQIIWTCAQCGLVQRPGDSCHDCRLCSELPETKGTRQNPRAALVSV